MPRIILSVYNKTDIVPFGQRLQDLGWELVASGGTADALLGRESKTKELIPGALRLTGPLTEVAQVTGAQPILQHRVLTLYPQIHAGILAAQSMREELEALGYEWTDAVCVDLYPLEQAVVDARRRFLNNEINGVDALRSAVELMDIGGPTMLRGCAKGAVEGRYVLCGLDHRSQFLAHLTDGCREDLDFRVRLAAETLDRFNAYDRPLTALMYELRAAGAFRQQ